MKLLRDVSFGVSSVGNKEALLLCLSSVLNASSVPARIQVRLEGQIPGFTCFYLEQIAEFARFQGVEFSLTVVKSKGIRCARDWHLDSCRTDYLWMGDDDVVYAYDCLDYLVEGMSSLLLKTKTTKDSDSIAYVCGSKGDLNNRRGYADFDTRIHGPEDIADNCPFHWFYDSKLCAGKIVNVCTMDTGNALFDISTIRKHGLRFYSMKDSYNSGGEDTLFAMECANLKLKGFFVPSAKAYHLEKEKLNFNEFDARKEMIVRVAELRKFRPDVIANVRKVFMPLTA